MYGKKVFGRYIAIFFLVSFVLAVAIAGFNMLVNPYGVWNIYHIVGFNYYQPHKEGFERINKPIEVLRFQPEVIFVGSSRVKYAINPDLYSEISGIDQVYNLGVNGANIYEVRRLIEHAVLNTKQVKRVVLGLDFMAFNENRPVAEGFDDAQLSAHRLDTKYYAQTLFSRSAVEASIESFQLNYQEKRDYDMRLPNGLATRQAAHNYRMMNKDDFWNFMLSVREYVNDPKLYYHYLPSERAFADLQAIVDLCKAHNIELTTYVSPIHVLQLEAIAVAGDWELYENWKRRVAAIVPYYDFSGYNRITSEAYSSDRVLFWDTAHVTPVVGDYIVRILLGRQVPEVPDNFYRYVTLDSVEDDIKRIHSERMAWLAENKFLHQFAATLAGFIEGPLVELEGKEVKADCLNLKVNGIRGKQFSDVVSISGDERLNMWGWFNYKGDKKGASDPVIVLVSQKDGVSYYHYMELEDKPEMDSFFKSSNLLGQAFAFDCRVDKLPKGQYKMHIEYADASHVYQSVEAPFVLQIE